MLAIVEQPALPEQARLVEGALPGALSAVVDDHGLRRVADGPLGVADALAEVHLFGVHVVVGVEAGRARQLGQGLEA